MIKKLIAILVGLIVCISVYFSINSNQNEVEFPQLTIAGSIYVGWMPWFLASDDGTLNKIGKEHGLDLKFVRGDYIETINQFAAGGVDAVVLTNIDAVSLLVGSGVATDVILIGSYSNGNDAILLPNENKDIKGKRLGLVEYSVSHYLLDRYLEKNQIPVNLVEKLNVSDSEIAAAFATDGSEIDGVVTWNPIVMQIETQLQAFKLADSQTIPKEIADLLVVRRSVLKKHPEFAQALLKTWFSVMERMKGKDNESVIAELGRLSGGSGEQYNKQLETTILLNKPINALAEFDDTSLKDTMSHVRRFVERYDLVTKAPDGRWVSFKGEEPKLIHFNSEPLKQFNQQ